MDIVQFAKAEYKKDAEHWDKNYQPAKEDLYFLSDAEDAQWDERDLQERRSTGRPALTIDQLGQFVHQVVNDIRMNTPSINVIPSGGESSVETAEIIKGLIRNIEYVSNADDVYDNAANFSVKSSIGHIRIDHDYVDDEGFDQQLLIKRVINSFAVYLDRNSIEADGRDAMHCTILDKVQVREFKKLYPNFDVKSFEVSENKDELKDDDYVTIAEFFKIEETEVTIGLLEDGTQEEMVDKKPYKATRTTKKRKVMRYKLSGSDVLEETTFPGKYIPIVPVYGEEAWREGERHIYSLIRKSKQAQQMFNIWKSLETEIIMKQPNAPVMAPAGATENYKDDWLDPSKSMVLRYDTTDNLGNQLDPPQRLAPPSVPAGIVNASRETVDDIKATMGMYNASLGQRSNEQSGKAIIARQQEGDVATYHFADNLNRSITHVGRILVCAIPEIYDSSRIIRIIGEEDEPKEVGINGEMTEGQEHHYDLTKGKYDVRVITGASFTTKRQETAVFLQDLFARQPELMPVLGDIFFKNSDFAGAQAMANRVKKLIDPKLLEDSEKEDVQKVDPEKEQMKQLIEQGAAELQRLQAELENKNAETQLKQGDLQLKQQELVLKEQELEVKKVEAAAKFQLENKKLETEVITSRHAAKASAAPETVMTDGELHEDGIAPIEHIVGQLSQAIMQQAEVMNQGLMQVAMAQEQMAASQQQTAQVLAQGNAQLAQAINQPKSVVYDKDGRLLGVK